MLREKATNGVSTSIFDIANYTRDQEYDFALAVNASGLPKLSTRVTGRKGTRLGLQTQPFTGPAAVLPPGRP
jgi:hypothetical protein